MDNTIDQMVRENIRNMKPYSSARDEFKGSASVYLDANENPFGSPLDNGVYNRYPDPLQIKLKEKISQIKAVPLPNIFLGNGSDEAIDILFRIFCEPARDNVIIFPPTYGMYEVCAEVNNVKIKKVNLLPDFQIDMDKLEESIDHFTKIIFICSPNNPTGNSIRRTDIEIILNNFEGIVVVDEAYINYSKQKTMALELAEYPNLVILQTFSKAWGLAGLRLGMGFAGTTIINYMNKVKYPYNINQATQQISLAALDNIDTVNEWIRTTVDQREWLRSALSGLSFTVVVVPSDANFLLARMNNAKEIYEYLMNRGIIVRDRSNVELCDDCLRITVGNPNENIQLLEALNKYEKEKIIAH